MKILEVGAGTGSATASLLRILGNGHDRDSLNPRYAHWEYTDISRSFFGEAAKRFASEGRRMTFKSLDIEKDPADQGFEYATYDLLLASMVRALPTLNILLNQTLTFYMSRCSTLRQIWPRH